MRHLRRYRKYTTQGLLVVLAVGVWALAVERYPGVAAHAGPAPAATSFTSAPTPGVGDFHRINIKDANGTTRLVISNGKLSPPPIIRGKAYKRMTRHTAGLIFYDARGNEDGGLASDMIGQDRQANLTLDYVHQPSEAISMGVRESLNGKHWGAQFSINDRNPYHPGPLTAKDMNQVQRVALQDSDHDAELIIRDEQGRPRIRIGVGKNGKPHIEMLNAVGKVVYEAKMMKVAAASK